MERNILPDNHYSLQVIEDVNSICKPLFNTTGIKIFSYVRYFNNNTCYALTTHRGFCQHRFKHAFKFYPIAPNKVVDKRFYHLSTQDTCYNQLLDDVNKMFNIGHVIVFIERYGNYFDLYGYGAAANNNSIINFYLNNLDVLEKFKFYFKERAAKLIQNANSNKLIIPDHMQPNFKGIEINNNNHVDTRKSLLQQIDVKRYVLSGKYEGITLTKREVDALKLLSTGYSIKKMAMYLNISPRTAECFIENAKNKLNATNRAELIKISQEFL